MKRFLLKVVPYIVVLIVFVVVMPYIIDPYNVFHVDRIRNNGVTMNERYAKMSYLVKNIEKYDSFVFGNSRVGSLHVEKLDGLNCYNCNYSIGTPLENYHNIQTLLIKGAQIKKIFLGVDNMSYMTKESDHYADPMIMPYEYAIEHRESFYNVYLNPVMALKSLKLDGDDAVTEGVDTLYTYGWWLEYGHETLTGEEKLTPTVSYISNPRHEIDRTIADIELVRDICDQNGIELVVFTNPMHYVTMNDCINNWDYLYFLEKLSEVTDYYNFSVLNEITEDDSNFVDTSHYTAEVGDWILNIINSGDKDNNKIDDVFGCYVTAENVEEVVLMIQQSAVN